MGLSRWYQTVMRDRPVFYAPMWEPTNGSRDVVGFGGTVTLFGGGSPTFFRGPLGDHAKRLPGTNNNAYVYADANRYDLGDFWTLESWFNPLATGTSAVQTSIISKGAIGGNEAYNLQWDSTNDRILAQKAEIITLVLSPSGGVTDAAPLYVHVVATRNGTTDIRLYLNGKNVTIANATDSTENNTQNLVLGGQGNSGGTIDFESFCIQSHSAVYNYALSSGQVRDHYYSFRRNNRRYKR